MEFLIYWNKNYFVPGAYSWLNKWDFMDLPNQLK